MRTPVRVCFREEKAVLAADFQRAVLEWIAEFEARYSRFIPESIIGQINAGAGGDWMDVDGETDDLFSLCDQMYQFTRGVFDAAALPLMRLWGLEGQGAASSRSRDRRDRTRHQRMGQYPAPPWRHSNFLRPAWGSTSAGSERNMRSIAC